MTVAEHLSHILSIKQSDLSNFQREWAKFDCYGTGLIRTIHLPELLLNLPPPIGYKFQDVGFVITES